MSEQWRGLHNHQRHSGEFLDPGISDCPCCECRYCAADSPCRCCMDQEARNLRNENEALGEALDDAERIVGVLEAQVQRVREIPEKGDDPIRLDYICGWNDALDHVGQALDGDGR